MIEQINIKSNSGNISALLFTSSFSLDKKGVLFMHGFGHHKCETASLFSKIAHQLYKRNIDCLLFDFYGFGDSAGESSEVTFDTMLHDAKAALCYIQAYVEIIYIVTYGISATIASYLLNNANIALLISISPRFDPFPTVKKIFLHNDISEIVEIAEYLDNITFVNYLRSFGADSGNMGGYKISQKFIESFTDKKPSKNLFEANVKLYLIHADTDLLLKTKSYQNLIKSFDYKILDKTDRFFVNAIKQDEIIIDIVSKISGE